LAAGTPVAAPAVGDIASMVSEENRPLVTPAGDEAALGGTLAALAHDAALRARLGKANRAEARARFDEKPMIDAYRRLYASAMGRPSLP
jgi:glycosyltransferase involved in cell wall biosynthesis